MVSTVLCPLYNSLSMHMVPLLCIQGHGMFYMCPIAYNTFVIVAYMHAGIQGTLHGEG